jgi:hypothetical protein
MTSLRHRELLLHAAGHTSETQIFTLELAIGFENARTPQNRKLATGVSGHVLDKGSISVPAQGTPRDREALQK